MQKSKISKDSIFGPHGRLKKFKGHNSSGIYWRMIKILKGGMSKKEDQIKKGNQLWYYVFLVHLFSTCISIFEAFIWSFFKDLLLENINGNASMQNYFSLRGRKDSVYKNQNSWENKWNASPASGIFIRTLIWAHH